MSPTATNTTKLLIIISATSATIFTNTTNSHHSTTNHSYYQYYRFLLPKQPPTMTNSNSTTTTSTNNSNNNDITWTKLELSEKEPTEGERVVHGYRGRRRVHGRTHCEYSERRNPPSSTSWWTLCTPRSRSSAWRAGRLLSRTSCGNTPSVWMRASGGNKRKRWQEQKKGNESGHNDIIWASGLSGRGGPEGRVIDAPCIATRIYGYRDRACWQLTDENYEALKKTKKWWMGLKHLKLKSKKASINPKFKKLEHKASRVNNFFKKRGKTLVISSWWNFWKVLWWNCLSSL